MKIRISIFDVVNIILMLCLMIITAFPLWYTVVGSLNDGYDYMRGNVFFWPRSFTTENYRAIFYERTILDAFNVTIAKCVIGTLTNVVLTTIVAYGITRPELKGKRIYIPFIMFTMYFSGGLIPYFMLIRDIGLYDSFWVYIIPGMFSVWNMVIIQSFIRELPGALIESAKMDGAGEYLVLFMIIFPLSLPVLAAITLFSFVGHWNSYFDSMMYTNSQSLQTMQLYLRKVINDPSVSTGLGVQAAQIVPDSARKITPQSVKFATMAITAAPIVFIYPFLQRYFVKGVTIGAVKG